MKRLVIGALCFAALACAKKTATKLDPAPPGKSSVQVVKANEAAKDFQAEADAIKQNGDNPDWGEVASRMEGVTTKHPGYGLAWYNLGVAYENLGRDDQAADAYRKALSTNNKLREAQENLAALAAKRGESNEAVGLLQDLVDRDPGAADARVALAAHHLQRDEEQEATALARDALGYQPKHIGAYCVLAEASVKSKDHLRARLVAAQGLKIDPEASCLHYVLGLVALREKELATAIASFERAIAKDSSLLEARFHVAQISMGYKDFKKAIDNYAAVTQQNPKAVAAFVNLGVAHKGSGQFDAAEAAYKQAIDAAGTDGAPAAHYNLGVLYLRNMNKLPEAKEELKRYLQLSDGNNDKVFGMLEEIEKLEALAIEEKRMLEEAERQAEIDAKIAAEEAKKQAEADRLAAEEAKRAAEEPPDPSASEPKDEPKPEADKPKKKRRRSRPKKKDEPETPEIPEPDDFE
ncbi:MAG: tetratricopeptide repeat protein [Deltaproteobacteria bacterium]